MNLVAAYLVRSTPYAYCTVLVVAGTVPGNVFLGPAYLLRYEAGNYCIQHVVVTFRRFSSVPWSLN